MLGDETANAASKGAAQRKSRSSLLPILVGCVAILGVGIGAGIGIGYGIWHSDSPAQTGVQGTEGAAQAAAPGPPRRPIASSLSEQAYTSPGCPDGEHADPLVTIMLTSNNVTVKPLDATEVKGVNGTFGELTFPISSVPEVLPYVTNQPIEGRLFRDVLNTKEFLDDWASLASQLGGSDSFFQPAGAAKKQCRTSDGKVDPLGLLGPDTITQNQSPNAMIRFDSDPTNAVVVDVFDVRATDDGQNYVMTFRQVPSDAALNPEKEGQCHKRLTLTEPHYHHTSACMDTKADWDVQERAGQEDGAVVFINTGFTCDCPGGSCWGCCSSPKAPCCGSGFEYGTITNSECTCTDGTNVWGCCLSKKNCPSPPE